MASTGRGISTAASSWAWARGPAGVMATAGAAIVLSVKAAEATAAAAGPWPIAAALPAAVEHAAERQFVLAATPTMRIQATHMSRSSIVAETMPAERVPAHLTRLRLAPTAVAERLMPAAAAVGADIKAAVDTSNRKLPI
jgi:hypothetical protein